MAAAVLLVLLFSLAIPLALWLAISQETSNPTVVDRTEAERIAKERGGRDRSGSTEGTDRTVAGDDCGATGRRDRSERTDRNDRPAGFDRDERDDGWGNRRT